MREKLTAKFSVTHLIATSPQRHPCCRRVPDIHFRCAENGELSQDRAHQDCTMVASKFRIGLFASAPDRTRAEYSNGCHGPHIRAFVFCEIRNVSNIGNRTIAGNGSLGRTARAQERGARSAFREQPLHAGSGIRPVPAAAWRRAAYRIRHLMQ